MKSALGTLLIFVAGCASEPASERPAQTSARLDPTAAASPALSSGAPVASASASASATVDRDAIQAGRRSSVVKSDEQVILFPSYASRSADGGGWKVDLTGWIFEPEEGDYLRDKAASKLWLALSLADAAADSQVFQSRVRPFLADNESGKAVSVSVAGQAFTLPPSSEDGHFLGSIELGDAAARPHAEGGLLTVKVLLRPGDERTMTTTVRLVEAVGLTIVSDIDDTVKITEVLDPKAVLRRTFVLPFEPVSGMAPRYRTWLGAEGHLHFVSSSPWQLFRPIEDLMTTAGFPAATYSLKRVRPRDVPTTVEALLADPLSTKPGAIRAVMDRFPTRRVVLVGDSGEKDPEVYAPFLRDHPDRVVRIYIRDVTGEKRDAPRYATVFSGLPADRWVIFGDAAELPATP